MNNGHATAEMKADIFSSVLCRMHSWYGESYITNGMACLYFMHAGLVELAQRGILGTPAAGTAYIQIIDADLDDGKVPTHFGYEWGGHAEGAIHAKVEGNPLPEMHCWIWLPTTQEVVDFTTGTAPVMARKLGFKWQTAEPPPFVWDKPIRLLPRFIYGQNRDATRLAVARLVAGQTTETKQ